MTPHPTAAHLDPVVLRHLRLGWGGLTVVVVLGAVLEGLHAFKIATYLAQEHETRRLMWRLAHAHAAGLSLVSIAFAATLPRLPRAASASLPLSWGIVLCPLGFFLGGLGAKDADPSLGIALLPPGAALIALALGRVLSALWTRSDQSETRTGMDSPSSKPDAESAPP